MNNLNAIFDNIGGAANAVPPAPAAGATPNYGYVDSLPSTVPDIPAPQIPAADIRTALPVEEKFDYKAMIEGISAAGEGLSEAEDRNKPAAPSPAMMSRGAGPSGPAVNLYGNLTGPSYGMNALQQGQAGIGGQPNINQMLAALSGR